MVISGISETNSRIAALAVGVLGIWVTPASAANGCTLTGAANGKTGAAQKLTFAGCLGATTLTATWQ